MPARLRRGTSCEHRRAIRLKRVDVDAFMEASRITPGELRHLYPGGDDGV
ncbi:MAG: hypothetical protein IPM45_02500 [Acidimicrobiales bacterium]|nr:hypothetical protein [Acidimicrobiales bacterium]